MSSIRIEDFSYMHQGEIRRKLQADDAHILSPIRIENKEHDRALLIFHGFSSSPAVYRLMLSKLTSYDGLFCPLLPGHGLSIRSFSEVKATDWLHHVESCYQDLAQHYNTVDIMGLSLGGLLSCYLAQIYPVNHLYLLAPALFLRNNLHLTHIGARFLQKLGFTTIRNRGGDLCSLNHEELTYCQLPLSSILEILNLIEGFKLNPLSCSVDLFLGRHDKVVNSEKVATQAKLWPNTTIHWLENSAHILPLDNDVESVIQLINHKSQSR